jgi:hypothetical protein
MNRNSGRLLTCAARKTVAPGASRELRSRVAAGERPGRWADRMMPRVLVTDEERAFIEQRVDRYADEAPTELRWQLPYVRAHGALPLYVGWTETAAIRPNGEMVRWSTEGDWPGARELSERIWITTALVRGAARYPQLRRLVPSRPDGARTCEVCGGTGRFPLRSGIICQCGGVGWIDDAD